MADGGPRQQFAELFADWAVGAAVRQSSYDPERVVAYELTGFTAHCENNPSQAQLFDQHAVGGGREGGKQIVSCSGVEEAAVLKGWRRPLPGEGQAVRTSRSCKGVCVCVCLFQAAFVLILTPCSSLQTQSNQAKCSEGRKSRSDGDRLPK